MSQTPTCGKPGWQALDFAMPYPHYYSYELQVDEQSFTVTAHGDLDCDGVYSTFSWSGRVVDGRVVPAAEITIVRTLE